MDRTITPRQLVTKDILVLLNEKGILLGLDIRHGRQVWRVECSLTTYPELVDVTEVGGQIYLISYEKDYVISALDEYSGRVRWETRVDGFLPYNALLSTNGLLIITDRGRHRTSLKAVDIKTGEPKWRFGMIGHDGGFDPIIFENRLYVGGACDNHYDEVYQTDGQTIWTIKLYCLDILSGKVLWESDQKYPYSDAGHRETPLISPDHQQADRGGILCVKSRDNQLHMLDTVSGEVQWVYDTETGQVLWS